MVTKRGFQINHIAQQNIFAQQFVTPDGDRLECQRAFAKPQNHCIATCFDPLGDGNLTLAAQELHRAHFTQIHTHRIIRPVEFFVICPRKRYIAVLIGGHQIRWAFVFIFFRFMLFGYLNAHFREHRHDIFYLIGRYLIGRQNCV